MKKIDFLNKEITSDFLSNNLDYVFVFGDNLQRTGTGGAAALRYHKNTYGFITKKTPSHSTEAYYKKSEYIEVYLKEILKIREEMKNNPDKIYLISKVGAGLANFFMIWEKIIEPTIKSLLQDQDNVIFLWE